MGGGERKRQRQRGGKGERGGEGVILFCVGLVRVHRLIEIELLFSSVLV